ncbi:MAG: hypothetical protein DRI81_20190 [Chloroflexi bacterium]|nr:MAG: hypothetical protein DRI81_20190 [Chloroflexota bacterium]
MLRGSLTDEQKSSISARLPDLDELIKVRVYLDAEWDSMRFGHEPIIPVAGVCLRDAISMLSMSRFAAYEACAHQIWYREHTTRDNAELYALWLGRFFADDAALRLYVVGEHLANSIRIVLRIADDDLKPYKKKYTSLQTVIGNYLGTELPEHEITKVVERLKSTPEWKWIRDYRDEWVHEQPPLMAGFGKQFNRKPKWRSVKGASIPQRVLSITSKGDPPKYTVDELLDNVLGALFAVTKTTTALLEYYIQLVRSEGAGFE